MTPSVIGSVTAKRQRRVKGVQGGGGYPSYMASQPLNTWFEIAGTKLEDAQAGFSNPTPGGGEGKQVWSYSSVAVDTVLSRIYPSCCGGHGAYAGNETYMIDMLLNGPNWGVLKTPTPLAYVVPQNPGSGFAYYLQEPDGKIRPSSRHTGWNLRFVQGWGPMNFASWATYGSIGDGAYANVDGFNLTTNDYYVPGTFPNLPFASYNSPTGICDDIDGNVVYWDAGQGNIAKWDRIANTWFTGTNQGPYDNKTPLVRDKLNNQAIRFTGPSSPSGNVAKRLNLTTLVASNITFTGLTSKITQSISVTWVEELNAFLLMPWDEPCNVYKVTPVNATTYDVTVYSVSGTPPPAPGPVDGDKNLYERFGYLPNLKLIYYIRGKSDNIWAYRVGT